jgi:hypothetical protein
MEVGFVWGRIRIRVLSAQERPPVGGLSVVRFCELFGFRLWFQAVALFERNHSDLNTIFPKVPVRLLCGPAVKKSWLGWPLVLLGAPPPNLIPQS